ncbi:hypothetical protein AGMMS49960_16830 [Betaproteobacteria bacterium]|nr:hypothetical protein AGMMS49543_03310 [Betaproteobacteria bacterium]GHU03082.1 hypothetical protein AGMMS49960_16830 [Betaproteobacteria bacterium]GHU23905.1 hypothetical protein AGMMS50243_26170 [Betaproteobacteria bacterium]
MTTVIERTQLPEWILARIDSARVMASVIGDTVTLSPLREAATDVLRADVSRKQKRLEAFARLDGILRGFDIDEQKIRDERMARQ